MENGPLLVYKQFLMNKTNYEKKINNTYIAKFNNYLKNNSL